MNKITVFWIEDNPIQMNTEEINGKEYPEFLNCNFFNYFLFQHPKQVEEYLSMINVLDEKKTYLAEKCPDALPDIVVFDYKLAEAFKYNTNALRYSDDDNYNYLKSKSASHKLKVSFEALFKTQLLFLDKYEVRDGLYMADKFKSEIKAEQILPDDEFGLYCGLTIIREFKEYISVGVPATINKADKTTMSYNSLFYEWINNYDLKGAIERPVSTPDKIKDWFEILKFSAELLRKRILSQIKVSKVIPDYSQLLALSEGNIPNNPIFSFETIYGKRNLPFDGLFFDKSNVSELREKDDFVDFLKKLKENYNDLISKKEKLEKSIDKKSDKKQNKIEQLNEILSLMGDLNTKIETLENFNKNERSIEIWRFANTILSWLPTNISIIKKANETATTLWNTYLNEFEDRIILSDYSCRFASLNRSEKEYLEEVKKRLGVNPNTGLLAKECSIKTILQSEKDKNVKRLTFLIVVTNASIEMEKQRVESNFNEKYSTLTNFELLNILFPKVNFKDSLLLPMNVADKDKQTENERKWLAQNLSIENSTKITIGNIFQIEKWLNKGEKEILKSLFYKESKYFPHWLK